MSREFRTTAPNLQQVWLLPGLLLLAGVIGIVVAMRTEPRAAAALLGIAAIGLSIAWSVRHRTVRIDERRLIVQAGPFRTNQPVADFDLDAARIVNLNETPTLKPMLKLFGIGLLGYAGGHFWLRDRSTAFVLLTDPTRVLVLPNRQGRKVLLSMEQPQALLDALRTVARGRARG